MMKNRKTKGKIIVIDGIDGVGKRTQSELLVKNLKKLKLLSGKKLKVVRVDFPQYKNNFIGSNILEFLQNEEFNFLKIHPQIASIVYAADRWEAKVKLEKYLADGYIVILDRYVSSNQIHQGGKIKDEGKRKDFLKWLEILEYKTFKIPKPDLQIFLTLPVAEALRLTETRHGKDLAEQDLEYQKNSFDTVSWLLTQDKKIKSIDCLDKNTGKIREINDINLEVQKLVKKYCKI